MNTSTFDKKIEIGFWFEYTEKLESLSFEEREILEEQAKESIFQFIINNHYTSGQLCESIDDKEFYGWWNYRISNK